MASEDLDNIVPMIPVFQIADASPDVGGQQHQPVGNGYVDIAGPGNVKGAPRFDGLKPGHCQSNRRTRLADCHY